MTDVAPVSNDRDQAPAVIKKRGRGRPPVYKLSDKRKAQLKEVNTPLHCIFYPRDAMLTQVFATATCPDICPDVRHTPVLCLAERKQDREMYTIW